MNHAAEPIHSSISGGFLRHYMDIIADKALPYQWQVISGQRGPNPTVNNFRIAAGEVKGEFGGVPYQDTDLSKWLDAVGCALRNRRDASLEAIADAVIETIANAQDADGYLDTYYQLVRPNEKWTDPDSHELYCFGHMIEAGVAYWEGTGKTRLLEVACRMADHVCRVFGPEAGQLHGYRGHEIIEMALCRLFRATGGTRYRDTAVWFVHARRDTPEQFYQATRKEGNPLDYGCWGWGDPERETSSYEHVTGHAVRAMYLYAGMADVAQLTGDEALLAHCRELLDEVTRRQMYITGGIGTTSVLEAYTYPYDLPNDTMYAETCASIGLCFFAHRMLMMQPDGELSDVIERCIYNILPAAIAQDGQHYFYVNPLQVNEEACRRDPLKTHVKPVRQAWYECACCPPNLARFFSSLPRYTATAQEGRLWLHLYAQGCTSFELGGANITVAQHTDYPMEGRVRITVATDKPTAFALMLRIPGWCRRFWIDGRPGSSGMLSRGYLAIERNWSGETALTLELDMTPYMMQAHPRVREDSGKVVLTRGPVVYCCEEADNGALVEDLRVSASAPIEQTWQNDVPGFGEYVGLSVPGKASSAAALAEERLYFPVEMSARNVTVKAIPYCLWGERVPGEMTVWIGRL